MSKVTSKLQITMPKAIAEEHGIRPGDDLVFESANDIIRLLPASRAPAALDIERRLELFDHATRRQQRRKPGARRGARSGRGWRREDLYDRPRTR